MQNGKQCPACGLEINVSPIFAGLPNLIRCPHCKTRLSGDESYDGESKAPTIEPDPVDLPFEYFSQTRRRVAAEARRQPHAMGWRRYWGAAAITAGAVLGTVGLGIVRRSGNAEIIERATSVIVSGLIIGPLIVVALYNLLVFWIAMSEAKREILLGQQNPDSIGTGAFGQFLKRPWPVLRFLVYVSPAIVAGLGLKQEEWSWTRFLWGTGGSLAAAFALFFSRRGANRGSAFD